MTTRRNVLKGGLAAAALTSAPSIIRTQAQPAAARTVKAVIHADLRNSACRGVLGMPEMVAFWNMEKVARA